MDSDLPKVFLGGICNGSKWREKLIENLYISYFNPVVENWTPECQAEEIRQRETCDYCLYTITPKMTGMYSIAEVVDDSNKRPSNTVLIILEEDEGETFTPHQSKSLKAVASMVEKNGAKVFTDLYSAAEWFNMW